MHDNDAPTPLEVSYALGLADDQLADAIDRIRQMIPPPSHIAEGHLHQARREISFARTLIETEIRASR